MSDEKKPMRLYKFCTYDTAVKVLTQDRIKLSEFDDMNDPFELAGMSIDDFSPMEDVIDHWRRTICALCLTKDWQHPLMWSHYADKYKGVCLAFDFFPHEGEAQPVYYVETIEPFTEDLGQLLKAPAKAEGVFKKILLSKFKAWEYESEIRVLATRKDKVDGHYFYELNEHLVLKAMILGPRCEASVETLMTTQQRGVEVHRATVSRTEFKVVLDESGDALKRLAKMIAKAERRTKHE